VADASESLESRGDSRKGNVSRRELFCPHCDYLIPKTTYYRHREQFYNPIQEVWSAVKLNTTTTMPAAGECECEEMDFATFGEETFPIEGKGEAEVTAEVMATTES